MITRAGTPHTRAAWARGRGLDGETYLSVASSCAAPASRRLVWGPKLWRGVPVCEQPPICCVSQSKIQQQFTGCKAHRFLPLRAQLHAKTPHDTTDMRAGCRRQFLEHAARSKGAGCTHAFSWGVEDDEEALCEVCLESWSKPKGRSEPGTTSAKKKPKNQAQMCA